MTNEEKLKAFFADKVIMEAVYAHFIDYLQREAVSRTLGRRDVSGIADAFDCLEGAYMELFEKYGPKKKQVPRSIR